MTRENAQSTLDALQITRHADTIIYCTGTHRHNIDVGVALTERRLVA